MTKEEKLAKLAEFRELWKNSLPGDRKIIEARAKALQYSMKQEEKELDDIAEELFDVKVK